MLTIIEKLEQEIPHGHWCHSSSGWCPYHEIKKPVINEKGTIQSYFCNLMEEFVNRKKCEINQ